MKSIRHRRAAARVGRLALGLGLLLALAAGPAPGDDILKKMDENANVSTAHSVFRMTAQRGTGQRVKERELQSWGQGRDRSAMEVLSGPDQGVRILRLGSDLWISSPLADQPMKISGSMLRQSMLDTDWSYSDVTDSRLLTDRFEARIKNEESRGGRPTWVLELTAKKKTESYPRQVLWVDQETFVPVYQELRSLSGLLLKTLEFEDLRQVQGRWVPMKMTMRDALKKDRVTTVEVHEVQFDLDIDPKILSLEWVNKKP